MDAILAIDQGTTSTRAWRVEPDGTMHLVGRHKHRQIHPRPGWVEHDPRELLDAIRNLIARAGHVAAVGIANQGETVIAWDAWSKEPLHNAIVWQDVRTLRQIERLRADGVETLTRERAGLPLDPYFSAAKLRWLLDEVPRARTLLTDGRLRLGTSDAFFLDALTGTFATDVSTASRTSLMNLTALEWDESLCKAFGVPLECLPEIRPTLGDFGVLPDGTPVAVSVVDQQAALFGHGCRQRGDLKITFGTGGFALAFTGAPTRDPPGGLLPTCAWQTETHAEYALDGGITTAGAAVDWLRRIGLLSDLADQPTFTGRSVAEDGLIFVPAQAGLGCPHWDRTARALWIGMDLQTSREQLCRAVLEGVALRAAELVDAFAAALGPAQRVSVDGGLTRSVYFTHALSAALGRPVAVCESADMTGFGIAALWHRATLPLPSARMISAPPMPAAVHERFREAVERARRWRD